ncbi:MAG TPA: tetraacyldisaccharide 4'-kinase [Syntrophales bacterium]|nr:tetraacyldisaccharide 4'-kinase [Syntrophales bacterium]
MRTGTALRKLSNKLRTIWYSDINASFLNPLTLILSFVSLFYRSIVNFKNCTYDCGIIKQTKLPCKVISIGNITIGGTGKTPMVIMLAKSLKEKGYRPAVLSRGYGGKANSTVNVISDGSKVIMGQIEAGDEPILIAKAAEGIPVLTGPDRIQTGRFAIEKLRANILILDDAFQHRRIFRDVDIVILDRELPFGNGFLLPRGPLREPLGALNRAHFVIWRDRTRDGRYPKYQEQGIGWFRPVLSVYLRPKDIISADTGDVYPLESIKGKKVCAFAGIASPEAFSRTVESLGWTVKSFIDFPDHYQYTKADIAYIQRRCSDSSSDVIITTEKDGVRLTDFPDFLKDVFFLRVEMEMLPSREEFETLIFERLK